MEPRDGGSGETHAAKADALQSQVTLEDKGFVVNLTDCLSFSPAFTLTGFETINDKVLREMNDRAKRQLTNRPQSRPAGHASRTSASAKAGPAVPSTPAGSTFRKNAEPQSLSRAPPIGRPLPQAPSSGPAAGLSNSYGLFGASGVSARPLPVPPSPSKRASAGDESPSKRLRAPSGAATAAPSSPTSSMAQLSLNEKERLMQVSAARQQTRRQNASPRRRQLHKPSEYAGRGPVSLNSRPLPSLKLDQPGESRVPEPLGKPLTPSLVSKRTVGDRPAVAQPVRGGRCVSHGTESRNIGPARSTPVRSVSATATSGLRISPSTTAKPAAARPAAVRHAAPAPVSGRRADVSSATLLPSDFDSLPSYARPTQAALRRSQSTVPHQQGQGLSQHLRPSSSTRSVSRLLN